MTSRAVHTSRWVTIFAVGVVCPCLLQARIVVTFHKSATVVGPSVCLGQVAHVAGDQPSQVHAMRNVVVCRAPGLGFHRFLSTDHIISYCLRKWSKHDMEFHNQGRIKVHTEFRTVPGEEIKKTADTYLKQHMPWKDAKISVRFLRYPDEVKVRNLPYRLAAACEPNYHFRGPGKILVAIQQDNEIEATPTVSFEVDVSIPVCVTRHKIPRGRCLSQQDICFRMRNITRSRHLWFTAAKDLVGQRAKRTILADRLIDDTMVEQPPVVANGDRVHLLVQSGNAVVKAEGVSRSDGYIGDQIPVYCLATRKPLKGRVQNNGQILIADPGGNP